MGNYIMERSLRERIKDLHDEVYGEIPHGVNEISDTELIINILESMLEMIEEYKKHTHMIS